MEKGKGRKGPNLIEEWKPSKEEKKEMERHHKIHVAEEIAKNMKAESDAMEEYYPLLNILEDEKDRATVEEILSDEKNHLIKLQAMQRKYDGIAPNRD